MRTNLFTKLILSLKIYPPPISTTSSAEEVVLIGGGYIFKESINLVNKLVLTRVNCDIDGDVFYPRLDFTEWSMISNESFKKDEENEYDFLVETYIRN